MLTIFSLIFTAVFSLTNLNMIKPDQMAFVSFRNYARILSDPYFHQALGNTLKFMVCAVLIETVFGLLMAVFVHQLTWQKNLIRTLLLLPMVLPPVTAVLIWRIK